MKIKETRALKPEALAEQLEAAHDELFNLRFRLTTKQLVNHREIRRVKRDIARLKTVIRERELEIR
ncbi:50S ribosomal protein L29 [Chloroflexota bacterium]